VSGRETALIRAKRVRAVLLDHGVPEVTVGGLLPGRPGPGDVWNGLDPVGLLSHHIASHPTPENPVPGLALVRNGRSDLPGPLANGTAGVDLVYRIITLGWANHPGFGGPLTVRGPLGAFTVPRDNGRPYLWGTEYEGGFSEAVWDRTYTNKRTGKKMTFREFMGRVNAGLAEAIWLPGISSRGRKPLPGMDLSGYHGEHKTWAPTRKIDRLGYTTESGRAEIRRFNTVEDDMFQQDDSDRLKRIEAMLEADKKRDANERERDVRLAKGIAARINVAEDRVLAALDEVTGGTPGEA
jgi:hypothetical protein